MVLGLDWAVMLGFFALTLIPPPPIPGPLQPSAFPEYVAACNLVDVDGFATSATLRVSGQQEERRMDLVLQATGIAWPKKIVVKPSWPRSGAWVEDVAYSYDEFGRSDGPEVLQLEVAGLGPRLDTLRIEVKRRPNSPIFEQPGLIGACRAKVGP